MHLLCPNRGRLYTVVVLLVLVVFVVLQSAAAMVIHPHNHGKDHPHCCVFCHVGHLAVLKTASGLRFMRPQLVASQLAVQEYHSTFDYRVVPSPSRAPPLRSTVSA
jgi:hypothetical protein